MAGFSLFLLGMTILAVVTDGSHRSVARHLRVTQPQLNALTIAAFFGCVSVGAIGSGLVTALWGTVRLGRRGRFATLGLVHGSVWTALACFVVAAIRGDGPLINWWIYGAEWALKFVPAAALVGAVLGYLASHLTRRRVERG